MREPSNNEQTMNFFQSQSSAIRNKIFQQTSAPIKVKLRKKKTEDSLVRNSLKQMDQMSQNVGAEKIDFH